MTVRGVILFVRRYTCLKYIALALSLYNSLMFGFDKSSGGADFFSKFKRIGGHEIAEVDGVHRWILGQRG